jgi:hypothetical protein
MFPSFQTPNYRDSKDKPLAALSRDEAFLAAQDQET